MTERANIADYLPEMAARQDKDPSRVYRPLRAKPEREISIVRRADRSVSELCKRFLEIVRSRLSDG